MGEAERSIIVEGTATPARYEVVVGSGTLATAGEALSDMSAGAPIALISDENVYDIVGQPLAQSLGNLGTRVVPLLFPPGESSKTRSTVSRLQDAAIEAGLGRESWVVAIGGGVVGDVGGFVAATLFRGLNLVQIPTSLLAMVDSAVGGKTGVDTPSGKNLVGAFHPPRAVLADVDTLATLPDEELRAGLAEVIKYGVILDAQMFVDLEDGLLESCLARVPVALISIVERCVRLKAQVVREDEREANRRQVLNYGHTLGHAVETVCGYSIRHGEAVAIGMVVEARLAERLLDAPPDLASRVAELCSRADLPTRVPATLSTAALVDAALHDKKTRAGVIRCALPREIGAMAQQAGQWAIDVATADLAEAIEAV